MLGLYKEAEREGEREREREWEAIKIEIYTDRV